MMKNFKSSLILILYLSISGTSLRSEGEKVVISKSGNVNGNIIAPRVTLEDGAIFKGSIDMDPAGAPYGKVSQTSQQPANAPENSPKASGLDLKSV